MSLSRVCGFGVPGFGVWASGTPVPQQLPNQGFGFGVGHLATR